MRRCLIIIVLLLSACRPELQDESGYRVQYHPDGELFIGDQVSVEVIPFDGDRASGKKVKISLGDQELGTADFIPSGIGQRIQATFWWFWDTGELAAGEKNLNFEILPEGPSWQEKIILSPSKERPFPHAYWETSSTDCCTLAYISGTDAERDIESLRMMVDQEAELTGKLMNAELIEPINVTFMPRLLGHGGFASNGIYVTYMDDNITGNITSQVIRHELVHRIDRTLGGKYLPSMLVEGLAVYLSGGHFKPEPLLPRAAALLELEKYIPLKTLLEDFYFQQHEIGYLEAGALVEYLVGRYGWEDYQVFYRDIDEKGNLADSLEASLQEHFSISLEQLENDFLDEMRNQEVTAAIKNDLESTIAFYDGLRLYQEILDPSAFFLTAWFPDGIVMREKGITADLMRIPDKFENHFFEFLLRSASNLIVAGNYNLADLFLKINNGMLSLY